MKINKKMLFFHNNSNKKVKIKQKIVIKSSNKDHHNQFKGDKQSITKQNWKVFISKRRFADKLSINENSK